MRPVARKRTTRLEKANISGFHERLRFILGSESETSFANRANISKSGFNRILGGGLPSLDVLVAISEAADVSIDWLATGEEICVGRSAVEVMSERQIEDRLDAIENSLDISALKEAGGDEAVHNELTMIAERPTLSDRTRARADLILRLAFNDERAHLRHKQRENKWTFKITEARSRLDAASKICNWNHSTSSYQALLTLIVNYDIDDEMLNWLIFEISNSDRN